jgi:hypothetical protein
VDDGTAHAFGRVEGQLDRVLTELSGFGRELSEHGVRLDHVEDDVEELKSHRTADQRQGVTFRAALTASLITAAVSISGSAAVALFVK